MSVLGVFLTASLAQNVLLVHYFGVWPLAPSVYTPRRAAFVSISVTVALMWVTTIYAVLHRFVLGRFQLIYLETLTLVLVLVATVLLTVRVGTYLAPFLRRNLTEYTPIFVVNTTVFVVAISVPRVVDRFFLVPLAALAAGFGLFLAVVPIAAIRKHMDRSRVPRIIRGDVSVYLATALTALAIQQIDRLFIRMIEPLW